MTQLDDTELLGSAPRSADFLDVIAGAGVKPLLDELFVAIAIKLQAYLLRWRAMNPHRWKEGAQVVASNLMQDVAFTDINIARLLETPGAMIAQVVQSVLPFPSNAEAAVMIEAIEIAAKRQTNSKVVGVLAVGVLLVIILWGLFGDG
jgi:hypothetical protein